jgi:hypothetical protein
MFRRLRVRARIGFVLMICLLYQQVAVAAFACARLPEAQPAMPPGMEHCAQMDMAPTQAQSSLLCEKHCAPDLSVTSDTPIPSVPAMALPPAFSLVLNPPVPHVATQLEVPISRSDPPPRLRYCSLLI